MAKKMVILGTAHLSSTAGKRSPDGSFREYKYSREICSELYKRLDAQGIDCVIDYMGNDMPGLTSSQELVKRVEIVNNYCKYYGASNTLYVSIHVNAAANSGWYNATGFSIYTSKGTTASDKAATCIYNEAEKILNPLGRTLRKDMSDGDPDFEESLYVLNKTSCPAVLTENFFQDNKQDIMWLDSPEGREAVISYHEKGILKYLSL